MRTPRTGTMAIAVATLAGAAAGAAGGPPSGRAARMSDTPAAVPASPPPVRPVFSADVDIVAVDVNVVDKQGRPVPGLRPEDFTITVDGAPRRVLSADFVSEATEQPAEPEAPPGPDRIVSTNEGLRRGRIVVIVVDQGNIRPGVGRHALHAADRLLDALNPQDQLALVTMPGGGPQVDLTTEHVRVRTALKRIMGRAQYGGSRVSLAEAEAFDQRRPADFQPVLDRFCPRTMEPLQREICVNDIEGEASSVIANFHQQSRVSLKGLALLMESLRQIEGPKTVVLITEGLSSDHPDELRSVANAAAAARVAFFAIHVDESGMPDPSRSAPRTTAVEDDDIVTRDLFRLSTLTRGAVFSTVGSARPFERIAREISAYYLVGFEPQGSDRDGKDHVIDVEVGRPALTVRARRALPMAGPRLDQREMLASTLRSTRPAIELPLRVTTYSSHDASSGKVRVVVSAEIGRGATSPAGLGVGFALVDDKGRVAASSYQRIGDAAQASADAPVSYLGAALVDPGRYTLKLAAMDGRGRRGSVEHPVRAVLTAIGPLEASDLVVAPPARGPGATLRPGVEVEIDAGAMTAFVELHGNDLDALKRATVSVELAADEVGPALLTAPARLSDAGNGQRAAQGALSLSLIPPGRYVARAVVSIAGKPMGQVTRPITVAASRAGGMPAAFSADALASLRFDRRLVLEPQVVEDALDALATGGPSPSPTVAQAAAEARRGRVDRLADLLSAGEVPSAPLAFLRGLGLYARGEMVAAADQFRTALRLRPDFVSATLYLGAASAALGRDQDAIGAWNTAMLEEARSPVLSLLLGDALLRRGELDPAIDLLREAAASWPGDERFRQRLGLVYAAAGRPADALPLLSAQVEAHPDDLDTLLAMVRLLYEGQGKDASLRDRFLRHARAYVGAAGPQQALVAQWIKAVEKSP